MTRRSVAAIRPEDLAAVEEIKNLKARYCYCVDHKDWEGWVSLFTIDARVNEGEFTIARNPATGERIPNDKFSFEFLESLTAFVEWPVVGREGLLKFGQTIAGNNISAHHVFAPEMEVTSATTARAVWPMEDYVWWPEGSPMRYMHGFGHYHESY